jgi:hypothetical protein
MGILDWFKNRSTHPGAEVLPSEDVTQAIDKAVTLTNPRLKLLGSCEETLRRPVEKCIARLREAMSALPPPIRVSEADWAGESVLRAIFARAPEVSATLGRSRNLRTFFDKYAGIGQAFIVLGAACNERQASAPSLQGGARRDIAQTVVDFSDPTVRICGQTDAEVRRLLGMRSFEHLVAQAMTEISEAREGRRELEDGRKLIQARLRLLQQQGPGLGALFDAAPERVEQRQLEAKLLENERQMEEHGSARSALEYELECLRNVLENSRDHLVFETRRIRLSTLNVILDENSTEAGADVAFTVAKLSDARKTQRAFVVGCLGRSDMPQMKLDIANAERFL